MLARLYCQYLHFLFDYNMILDSRIFVKLTTNFMFAISIVNEWNHMPDFWIEWMKSYVGLLDWLDCLKYVWIGIRCRLRNWIRLLGSDWKQIGHFNYTVICVGLADARPTLTIEFLIVCVGQTHENNLFQLPFLYFVGLTHA